LLPAENSYDLAFQQSQNGKLREPGTHQLAIAVMIKSILNPIEEQTFFHQPKNVFSCQFEWSIRKSEVTERAENVFGAVIHLQDAVVGHPCYAQFDLLVRKFDEFAKNLAIFAFGVCKVLKGNCIVP
jgi:hypothetical protein